MDRLLQSGGVEGQAIGTVGEAKVRLVYNGGPLEGGLGWR